MILTSKPIIPPASLVRLTVRIIPTRLSRHIRTLQLTSLETFLCSLLLCLSRQVSRRQELVYESLVLTDSVSEHAAMVTVSIQTPLHIDHIASLVSYDGL
jgi:hypothetical protein